MDDGELRELSARGEASPAGGRPRLVPVGEAATVCPVCGATPAGRPGLGRQESQRRVTPPRTITTAVHLIPTLTPQERKTFELLGTGYDNRSIARALEISERTAKRHVTAILSKLKLESRLQAGLAALMALSLTPTDGYWPEGRMDRPADRP